MDLAGYVINAVLVEGQSVAQVTATHGLSRSWLYELLARYRLSGDEGLKPRSRRPRSSPTRVSAAMESEIVDLRKSLAEDDLDAGADTIHYHLLCRHRRCTRGPTTPKPARRSSASTRR
ncbi:MAG: leucine zipper domain-containing protein [Actinomycetota bacterium]|nr:leucine zipper domain-containing protein [Actinomycetota bacterium]